MANVICHANQPNNLSKAMTYKHNYFITNQYTNYSFSFPNLIVNKFTLYIIYISTSTTCSHLYHHHYQYVHNQHSCAPLDKHYNLDISEIETRPLELY